MGCRLRAVVWGLTGLCVFTCLASVRWLTPNGGSLDAAERSPLPYAPVPYADSAAYMDGPDVAREMRWRQESVKAACPELSWRMTGGGVTEGAALDNLSKHSRALDHLIVDDRNQVLYCYVPKVACTNWKRMMLILTGGTNKTDPLAIPADSVHRMHKFRKLSDLKPDAIRRRLRTYTKFLFVRHPVERIISAFRNKFEKNFTSSAYFKERFGVKIMKTYRKGAAPGSIPSSGHGVRFHEFVSYLIDTNPVTYNEHWALVSDMCFPCDMRYDFIGKYETLAEDSKFILEQIGAPPSLHFPEVVPSKTTGVVESYFGSLTPQQQRELVQIYSEDFRIFDYHFKDYI